MDELTPDKLVAVYIKIRNAIKQKEDEVKVFQEQLDQVSQKLLEFCNAGNLDSIKTPEGTVSRRISSRYWTSDWESMYSFIRDNNALFLLEQRIHNGNMKEFLEANPDQLPAGLQSDRKYTVTVRKPSAK